MVVLGRGILSEFIWYFPRCDINVVQASAEQNAGRGQGPAAVPEQDQAEKVADGGD